MPITWITSLLGSLALIGFPGFSGFFSKDAIIEAVKYSSLPGSGLVYVMVLLGVFITALYSFRMYFLVFHGSERMDEHTREHLHETPKVVTVPLILLAIPSVVIGAIAIEPMLFGSHFGDAIVVAPYNDVLARLGENYHGVFGFVLHGMAAPAFWLAMAGVATAFYLYIVRPDLPAEIVKRFQAAHYVLMRKYGFDEMYEAVFAGGSRKIGSMLWRVGDENLIDGYLVNGSARLVGWFSTVVRRLQTGRLYHYAFSMIIGLVVLMTTFVFIGLDS